MTAHELEDVLRHSAWLRRLAGRLVSDPQVADDLVQDTWVRSLERPPGPKASLRAWLARVLRNEAHQHRRGEGRRRDRERLGARGEGTAATDELFERFAVQRELLARVEELEPADREVLLLRFFEDLPPRRMAQRLQLPTKTVESRLQRALARLRARLERGRSGGGGGRESWLSSLLLLADRRPTALSTGLGALAMSSKIFLGIGATTGALALGWILWPRAATPSAADPPLLAPTVGAALQGGADVSLDEAPSDSRERSPLPEDPAPPSRLEPSVPAISGRVVLPDGRAAAGVRVRYTPREGAPEEATSDGSGAFEVPGPRVFGGIEAVEPGLAPVLDAMVWEELDTRLLLVVAPDRPLRGRVVDEAGLPIAGARLALEVPEDFWVRLPEIVSDSQLRRFETESDAAGEFAFPVRPALDGSTFSVRKSGFREVAPPAPAEALSDWTIVLAALESATGIVEGVVLDPSGSPLPGTSLALGETFALSDEAGEFVFRLDEVEDPERLLALHPAHAPLELAAPRDADGRPAWPSFVELRFEAPALAIEGRVLDAQGRPVPDAPVWVEDPTEFVHAGTIPLYAENRLADTSRLWNHVTTDAGGRFRLAGLFPRDYLLRAADPVTTLLTEPHRVAAGDDAAVLRFRPEDLHERLECRVIDRDGAPVRARLQLSRAVFVVEATDGMKWAETIETAVVETDEAGACVLEDVPREGSELRVQADGFFPADLTLGPGDGAAPRVIRLARRCKLRIALGEEASGADVARVVDAAGEPQVLFYREGDTRFLTRDVPLVEGLQNLTAPDTGVELRLLRDGVEVGRWPLALDPGRLTTVGG